MVPLLLISITRDKYQFSLLNPEYACLYKFSGLDITKQI